MSGALSLTATTTSRRRTGTAQLLVSVRDAREARIAAECGADIVDAKDPRAGALGGVGPRVLEHIVAAVNDRCPVSAAIGDVGDQALVNAAQASAAGAIFVKVGCEQLDADASIALWLARAADVVRSACDHSGRCRVVLAAYADRVAADDASRFVDFAARGGAAGILVDTMNKSGPSLFGVMAPEVVAHWVERAHEADLQLALAGGLAARDIEMASALGADIVGVRGAVCVGGRIGRLSGDRVRELATVLRAGRTSDCS
jgi:uncharacterized protein (UPF0264 family)